MPLSPQTQSHVPPQMFPFVRLSSAAGEAAAAVHLGWLKVTFIKAESRCRHGSGEAYRLHYITAIWQEWRRHSSGSARHCFRPSEKEKRLKVLVSIKVPAHSGISQFPNSSVCQLALQLDINIESDLQDIQRPFYRFMFSPSYSSAELVSIDASRWISSLPVEPVGHFLSVPAHCFTFTSYPPSQDRHSG